MRNKFNKFLLKVCVSGILIFLVSFLINGCGTSERMSRKELAELKENLRMRKNSLELEKSYLKKILADSLLVDSLKIELKKCEEEIVNLKNIDSTNSNEIEM
ncbi:MAG: hypothetical protein ACPL25_04315 [Ignavibacteria bacterium]